MARPSDVILGLEVAPRSIKGRAFDCQGAELGGASHAFRHLKSATGLLELDPIQVWQAAVEVLHGVARAVPDLGRRTVALGISGAAGGLCLIDEDGEPVHPILAALEPDRLDEHRSSGDRRATTALLGRLIADQMVELDRAAHALDLRGWILACLTGRPLRVPPDSESPGGGRPTGQADQSWLVPAEASPGHPLPLRPAAAAASGLWDDTPVVVAPSSPVAAGLAAGIADPDFDGGVALLEAATWLIRPAERSGADGTVWWPDLRTVRLQEGEIGGAALDWWVELAQDLLAEAGLIGLTHAELAGLLERHADDATPGLVRFRRSLAPAPGAWTLEGLGAPCGFADVTRGIHEAIARSCRTAFEGDGGVPPEVRAAGALAGSLTGRSVLPALLGVPIRLLQRPAPAAVGAALCALRVIGEIDDFNAASASWIQPFLAPPVRADAGLIERYA